MSLQSFILKILLIYCIVSVCMCVPECVYMYQCEGTFEGQKRSLGLWESRIMDGHHTGAESHLGPL